MMDKNKVIDFTESKQKKVMETLTKEIQKGVEEIQDLNSKTPDELLVKGFEMASGMSNDFFSELDKSKERKALKIEKESPEWQQKGKKLTKKRESMNVGLKEIAAGIGVTPYRVRRLEEGQPVNDAKMMEKAYMLFLEVRKNKG